MLFSGGTLKVGYRSVREDFGRVRGLIDDRGAA
jgi:hypothetical protein